MPKLNQRLVRNLKEVGVMDTFLSDYPRLSRDELVGKYGSHFNTATTEYRRWRSMGEVANAFGFRRGAPAIPAGASEDAGVQEEVARDLAIEKLKAEADHYKTKYKTLAKVYSQGQTMMDALKSAVTPLTPPMQTGGLIRSKVEDRHTATALLSDLHVGEVVSTEETGGLAAYDIPIFAKRLGLWTAKVVELTELRRGSLYVPDLTIMLGGDMIAGDIHQELIKSNACDVMEQAVLAAYMISQSIAQLADHFEVINCYGVVGNHGRMTIKPPAKGQWHNWDYLVYQLMSMFLSKYGNVNFHLSKSFYQIVPVENTKVLLIHGDSIKGANGSPYYGMERAVMKMRQLLFQQGADFDIMAMGHFHDATENARFIVNGSFVGGDEFSAGKLHLANDPVQMLFYIHPEHGIVSTERIYLQPADKGNWDVQFNIPQVWAEGIIENG